jgi:hypothetical protein
MLKRAGGAGIRRRWFVFGPGLGIALALSAVIVVSHVLKMRQPQPAPVVVRQVVPERAGIGLFIPPASFLLQHSEELGLTADQRSDVEALQSAWEQEAAPLRRALQEAGAASERELNQARAGKRRMRSQELQERLQRYSELSGELSRRRAALWREALERLNETQRRRAEELRREAFEAPGAERISTVGTGDDEQ